MRYWTCVTLFLCFGLLISALPFPLPSSNHEIAPHQVVFDKRTEHDNRPNTPDPPKTPTPEDNPEVPVPGKSGVYYQREKKLVWFMYGDDLREHAEHIMLNHKKYPVNRKPMKLAGIQTHRINRQNALRGIPTQPGMARDEKPPATFEHPGSDTNPTVVMASIRESNREGGLLASGVALMKDHGAAGLIRANLGFKNPDPDMRLPMSAPPKLRTAEKFGGKPIAKPKLIRTSRIPRPVQYSNKNVVGASIQGGVLHPVSTIGGMSLRPRPGPVIPEWDPNVVAQKVKQQKDAAKARGKKTFLVELPPKLPPGQAWKPADGSPTHAGAPLPHRDFEGRRPDKFQSYAHMTHTREEKEAKDRSDADAQRRRVTLGSTHSGIPPHASAHGTLPAPRPLSPSLLAHLSRLSAHEYDLHAISGNNAVAGPSRHPHQDTHVGRSRSRSHSPASSTESGHHIIPVRPPGRFQSRLPVPINRSRSASPQPVHGRHDSPPAHNTRSHKGKEKEKHS
ncbi:hypothetical protein HYPSUDRAFT_52456 [Hypholoma sublateritium FD-334 SS-4]|uniref:Uncharacterized protein n=1 Tax=Hypholoma sublateritium (strain FD-334 SS-4) TaxID=945553 RepID=A0A0D2P6L2_HYPSF|nr:hypothetical protein HYPSUDRAFT_52456 [Hypholoma sublateritium FD-334 SS-4]